MTLRRRVEISTDIFDRLLRYSILSCQNLTLTRRSSRPACSLSLRRMTSKITEMTEVISLHNNSLSPPFLSWLLVETAVPQVFDHTVIKQNRKDLLVGNSGPFCTSSSVFVQQENTLKTPDKIMRKAFTHTHTHTPITCDPVT